MLVEAGCVCTHRLMSLSLATLTEILDQDLSLLKEMQAQMNTMQSFLKAHISRLETLGKVQLVQDSGKCGNTGLVFVLFDCFLINILPNWQIREKREST